MYAARADYNLFCKKYLECPVIADGKCNKLHFTKEVTEGHIGRFREKEKTEQAAVAATTGQ